MTGGRQYWADGVPDPRWFCGSADQDDRASICPPLLVGDERALHPCVRSGVELGGRFPRGRDEIDDESGSRQDDEQHDQANADTPAPPAKTARWVPERQGKRFSSLTLLGDWPNGFRGGRFSEEVGYASRRASSIAAMPMASAQ